MKHVPVINIVELYNIIYVYIQGKQNNELQNS